MSNYDTILAEELKAVAKEVKRSPSKLRKADKALAAERAQARVDAETSKPVTPSKRMMAAAVYARLAGSKRKVVIDAFKAEAALSANGAATYYQNFASGKWS